MRSESSDPRPQHTGPAGIYVHFPFCSVRCTYCDFPTVAGHDDRIEAYLEALVREIGTFQPDVPREADTVFLGGGTPSRMTPEQVRRVLRAVRERFDLAADGEITLEGNPESLTAARLAGYLEAGVTRVSVGVQSLEDKVLQRVGRAHGAAEAEAAVLRVRAEGFSSVSLDLIAGLPGEDLSRWGETLRRAVGLGPDHVSVYLIETDKDTPLSRSTRSGRTAATDEDTLAAAYEETVQVLEGEGLRLYEISNFAREGQRSRHNLKYWTDAPYAGFGLGSHAYARGERRGNRRDLEGYLTDLTVGRDPIVWSDPWDRDRRLAESLFLGLRVVEGVDLGSLGSRYGCDLRERYRDVWERAGEAALVTWEGDRVRLTSHGRLHSNDLFAELV